MNKRFLIKATAALAAVAAFGTAHAQTTPIKFQLDWRFEGPSAFFLLPAAKGHFRDAKLDVTVDSGNGSGGAVTRVASGTYDLGFADLAASNRPVGCSVSLGRAEPDTSLARTVAAPVRVAITARGMKKRVMVGSRYQEYAAA